MQMTFSMNTIFTYIFRKEQFRKTDRQPESPWQPPCFLRLPVKKVRADLAMTGEVTLRGRVLPIGGLKEKLLAAKNAGIKTVLVPKENERDVEELSTEITKGLEIIPVEHMDEVLKLALTKEETTESKKDSDKGSGQEK